MHAGLAKKNKIKELKDREGEEQVHIESAKGSRWGTRSLWWKGFDEKDML